MEFLNREFDIMRDIKELKIIELLYEKEKFFFFIHKQNYKLTDQ